MSTKYKLRFVRHSDETVKGYEVSKITSGLKREIRNNRLNKLMPWCVMVALIIVIVLSKLGG